LAAYKQPCVYASLACTTSISLRLVQGLLEYVAEKQIPVLGICYGMQLLVHSLEGGRVEAGDGEYGPMPIQ
jgi:GMP synthase (glutamine-hydrolysing)